jgi:RNA ligase
MKLNLPELESRVKQGYIHKFIDRDYIGWNYTTKCQYNEAWDEYTTVTRGIVSLPDGTVISRPFVKFFNYGDPRTEPIPWNEPVEITEKLDGSLICVAFFKGEILVNSRGSFTSIYADFAREFIDQHMAAWKQSEQLNSQIGKSGYTYLFEAIFPEKERPKTINYGDRADLTLLAAINTETGQELNYAELVDCAKIMGITVTPIYAADNINEFITKCKSRTIKEGEGVVLHFLESNKRIKVKSDEYLRIFRIMKQASRKHILASLINGDDLESVYSTLPDELYKEFKQKVDSITEDYADINSKAEAEVPRLKAITDKKERALLILNDPELCVLKSVLFEMLNDRGNPTKAIWDIVRKKIPVEPESEEET